MSNNGFNGLPRSRIDELGTYTEKLYDASTSVQTNAARQILALCTTAENISLVIRDCLKVLARILREEAKKDQELSLVVTTIFMVISTFIDTHRLLADNKVGDGMIRMLTYESSRVEFAAYDYKKKIDSIRKAQKVSALEEADIQKENKRHHEVLNKQDRRLFACVMTLFNIANVESTVVEQKMTSRPLVSLLLPLLSRNSRDLKLISVKFLHHLSRIQKNKNEIISGPQPSKKKEELGNDEISFHKEENVVEGIPSGSSGAVERVVLILSSAVSSEDEELVNECLRLLYNLFFDVRARIIAVSHDIIQILGSLIVTDMFAESVIRILYQLSQDAQTVSKYFVYHAHLCERVLVIAVASPPGLAPVLAALLTNLASCRNTARTLIDTKRAAPLISRSIRALKGGEVLNCEFLIFKFIETLLKDRNNVIALWKHLDSRSANTIIRTLVDSILSLSAPQLSISSLINILTSLCVDKLKINWTEENGRKLIELCSLIVRKFVIEYCGQKSRLPCINSVTYDISREQRGIIDSIPSHAEVTLSAIQLLGALAQHTADIVTDALTSSSNEDQKKSKKSKKKSKEEGNTEPDAEKVPLGDKEREVTSWELNQLVLAFADADLDMLLLEIADRAFELETDLVAQSLFTLECISFIPPVFHKISNRMSSEIHEGSPKLCVIAERLSAIVHQPAKYQLGVIASKLPNGNGNFVGKGLDQLLTKDACAHRVIMETLCHLAYSLSFLGLPAESGSELLRQVAFVAYNNDWMHIIENEKFEEAYFEDDLDEDFNGLRRMDDMEDDEENEILARQRLWLMQKDPHYRELSDFDLETQERFMAERHIYGNSF